MDFSNFISKGRVSPYTLWNAYTHGRLTRIVGKTIRSLLQPGHDGDCVSMVLSAGNIPSWYSLPCDIEESDYICKRLAETSLLPLPNHIATSVNYSKCSMQEVYAVNKCYFLNEATEFGSRVNVVIGNTEQRYFVHLLQCLNAVTSMNYQLQIKTTDAKMTHNNNHLCTLIESSTLVVNGNKIQNNIQDRKCIPTNTSKTFYIFPGRNITSDCESNQVRCKDGTCISQEYFCFDDISCSSKSCACGNEVKLVYDKHYCRHLCVLQNCSCPPHYFQCGSGGCIQFTLICDGKADCVDASDEMCQYSTRFIPDQKDSSHKSKTEGLYLIGHGFFCLGYHCPSGECIPLRYVNDLIPDCSGGQAEDENLFLHMVYHEEHFDCVGRSYHACVAGLPVCFPLNKLCLFDSDEEHNILLCRNGAHLQDCTYINCTNSYKCPQSYCIPFHRVCNGRPDCIHGEDEQMCDDYICKSLLRCKGSRICVHPDQICDGESHCPNDDDEGFCDWKSCSLNCTCVGYSMICTNVLTLPPLQAEYMRHMSVSKSYIPNPHFQNICYQTQLAHLNLSNNHIRDICNPFYSDCEFYNSLFLLDLAHNMIKTLRPSCFKKLTSLKVISLAHNNLQIIYGSAFFGLSLEYLDIKYTKITEITKTFLHGTLSIGMFDMRDIYLNFMDQYAENALSYFTEFIFNDPRLCCVISRAKICQKNVHLLISCPTILPHRHLGCISIVVGCFVIFLNVIGLIINVKLYKTSLHAETVSYLMSINVLLGTYLPLIGSVDIYYGQRIVLLHASWTKSILCNFIEVSSSTALMISLCLNGLLMFMTVGAVTRVNFHIIKRRLATGMLLMTAFTFIINLIPSLLKESKYPEADASGILCNILGASTVRSFSQHALSGIICIMMVSLLMYMLYGTITVIIYINRTTKEVLKFAESETAKNDARKRMVCKRMCELVFGMFMITLPYPLLKFSSIWRDDISQILHVGVMLSTIIVETFYIPLAYVYQPLLNRNCKRCGWNKLYLRVPKWNNVWMFRDSGTIFFTCKYGMHSVLQYSSKTLCTPRISAIITISRFKNGLLQFQQKSTLHTFQDWSPGGLICPKYNKIELHNIDLFGTTGY